MTVIFLNPSGQIGGAERSLLDILASLRASYPDWFLWLVVSSAGPLAVEAELLGVKVVVVPFPPVIARLGDAAVRGPAGDRIAPSVLLRRLLAAIPAVASYLFKLHRTISRIRPDVVHTNGFKMHLLGLWAAGLRTPVVWHLHDYLSRRPVMSRLLRWHRHRCSAIITNSLSVEEDVKAVCGNGVRVTTVYNAIDLGTFSPEGPSLDLDEISGLRGSGPGTIRVGLVATLGRWKGHTVFLRALAQLPDELDYRGYVIGGALYQTAGSQYGLGEIKALAGELGIADRVGFTGHVTDPAAAMRGVDIVVHASTEAEPFGLVIAEGMGCGKAVIASEAGGSAELFDSGVDAMGHPPGDVDALARSIHTLIVDERLREELGKNGRRTAEQRFDRQRLATDISPVYQEVMAARSR